MKVGIIGAGFTGLAACFALCQKGVEVTVFEKAPSPGGLALGFQLPNWEWSLEEHYHHWFTNDKAVLSLAQAIKYPVFVSRPKTSVYIENQIYQLDNPLSLLTFPKLSLLERTRMAFALGLLRYNPFWQPLEHFTAHTSLERMMGKRAYQTIWEPQMLHKFGRFYQDISLAWFWARIKKRTSSLAYPKGGFLNFAQALSQKCQEMGAKIIYQTEIQKLASKEKTTVSYEQNGELKQDSFDKILVTLPVAFFCRIASLPQEYLAKTKSLHSLGAINLVLRLKKPFFQDQTYWLSVCDEKAPLTALVEHTNMINPKHFAGEHIVYAGNYLEANHEFFSLTENQLLKRYHPFLQKINPAYDQELIGVHKFQTPFAQPIIPRNYSLLIPDFKTPLANVFLANMQQVYPWDRGTNYAVELGIKAAKLLVNKGQ